MKIKTQKIKMYSVLLYNRIINNKSKIIKMQINR